MSNSSGVGYESRVYIKTRILSRQRVLPMNRDRDGLHERCLVRLLLRDATEPGLRRMVSLQHRASRASAFALVATTKEEGTTRGWKSNKKKGKPVANVILGWRIEALILH